MMVLDVHLHSVGIIEVIHNIGIIIEHFCKEFEKFGISCLTTSDGVHVSSLLNFAHQVTTLPVRIISQLLSL